MKTIAFSAGGTLGHIMPALSFINKIKKERKDIKIIFLATIKDENYEILKNHQQIDQIYYLKVYGKPSKIFKYPQVIYYDVKALFKIKTILQENKVKMVIGMGGYISGLTLSVANHLKIPTIIHEQNSVLGLANKLNAKKAQVIMTTFKNTDGIKDLNKVKWIGNPRYTDALKYAYNPFLDCKSILITSGTLGSQKLNEVAVDFINSPFAKNYTITLITGQKYYEKVRAQIPERYNFIIKPFTNNLLEEISKVGIVVARAGSTTLFEIIGCMRPAIIVPSPNVVNNHQVSNAQSLATDEVIINILEENFDYQTLYNALEEITKNYHKYQKNLQNYQLEDPNQKFFNYFLELLGD